VCGITVHGHHYFGTDYFEDQTVTIEGTVVEFDYRNPHAWLYLAVSNEAGQTRRVGAEWGNPNRLGTQGVTKDTIKPADRVIVTGSPGRNPAANRIHLKKIERPADGWQWVARPRR
jgi:hypothetical protein